jgi:hypothetical protein
MGKHRRALFQTLAGVAFCLLVAAGRLGGLFDGLWEDEIHYNFVLLKAGSFEGLRTEIYWLMRPMLEFGLRRWMWFSCYGLSVTERNVALVAWLVATAHLLVVVLVPWSRRWTVRLAAGMLLGFSLVETAYSTEAQGYSFVSLASTLLFLGYWGTTRMLRKEPGFFSLLPFLAGFAVCLNAHFFSWPIALAMLAALVIDLIPSTPPGATRRRLLILLLVSTLAIAAFSLQLNQPSWSFLTTYPPSPTARTALDTGPALSHAPSTWRQLGLPGWLFAVLLIPGLFHPSPERRCAAAGLALSAVGVKFLLVMLMAAKSSYPIYDRYLIMFVSPAILALAFGLEALAERAERLRPRLGAWTAAAGLVVLGLALSPQWRDLPGRARAGVVQFLGTPPNYSASFQFFEKAKALRRPLLVLTDHCHATDAPKFYLEFVGKPVEHPEVVVDMVQNCDMTDAERSAAIRRFFAEHGQDGVVALYYEQHRRPDPCRVLGPGRVLYRHPQFACAALFDAAALRLQEIEGLSVIASGLPAR